MFSCSVKRALNRRSLDQCIHVYSIPSRVPIVLNTIERIHNYHSAYITRGYTENFPGSICDAILGSVDDSSNTKNSVNAVFSSLFALMKG